MSVSGGSDYTTIDIEVLFSIGSSVGTELCVEAMTTDDTAQEGNESFFVVLESFSANIPNSAATITIIDNDPGKCFSDCTIRTSAVLQTMDVCSYTRQSRQI